MVIHTSTWFWLQMSEVQEMSTRSQSKDREPGGNPCHETGAKTGKATRTSTAKAFHSKSQLVMEEPLLATMLHHLTGNLVRHFKEVNFNSSFL